MFLRSTWRTPRLHLQLAKRHQKTHTAGALYTEARQFHFEILDRNISKLLTKYFDPHVKVILDTIDLGTKSPNRSDDLHFI